MAAAELAASVRQDIAAAEAVAGVAVGMLTDVAVGMLAVVAVVPVECLRLPVEKVQVPTMPLLASAPNSPTSDRQAQVPQSCPMGWERSVCKTKVKCQQKICLLVCGCWSQRETVLPNLSLSRSRSRCIGWNLCHTRRSHRGDESIRWH